MRAQHALGAVASPLTLALAYVVAPPIAVAQAPAQWSVDAVPAVSIGGPGRPDGEFLVNPLLALLLSDGAIVVQNSLRDLFEIRYFDPDGESVTTVSRWGQGPYEFRRTLGLYRLDGDSVAVLGEAGRLAVWGPRGEPVREGRVDLSGAMPALMAVGVDAEHVAVLKPTGPAMPDPGIQRSPYSVLLLDMTSGHVELVATAQDKATFYQREGPGVRLFSVPFASRTWVVGGGGMLWIGDDASKEIRGYRPGAAGAAVVVECGFEGSPVTRDDRRRMREAYSSMYGGEQQKRWARYAASMDFPDRTPVFGQLKSDRFGNLWVQEYDRPWDEGTQLWRVYSPEGVELAEVSLPPEAVPACSRRARGDCGVFSDMLDVDPEYVLVRRADDLGVAQIDRFLVRHER